MRKHGWIFLATFVPTAAAVAALVLTQRSIAALVAGTTGLLLHWTLSSTKEADGELADSSYFFGFLLTLIYLAAGLLMLGSAAAGPNNQALVLGFLEALGAGLVLTIVGLIVRQIRTLSSAGRAAADPTDALTDAQRQLAAAMQTLVKALASRPEEVAARELQDTRTRAREATDRLEQTVVLAAERIGSSMSKLEQATTSVTSAVLRAGSGLGDSLTTSGERMQIAVGAILALLETQRRQLDESLRIAQAASEETQRELSDRMKVQLAEWRTTLQQSQQFLTAAHDSIDGEFQRGLTRLASAGAVFNALATQVTADVEALPNPAARLTGLWDGVRSLETTLTMSISGASEQLATLGRRSEELSNALIRLERSTGAAAGNIERGGAELGDALRRELTQMNQVLDEYTRLFEQNVGAFSAAGPR